MTGKIKTNTKTHKIHRQQWLHKYMFAGEDPSLQEHKPCLTFLQELKPCLTFLQEHKPCLFDLSTGIQTHVCPVYRNTNHV